MYIHNEPSPAVRAVSPVKNMFKAEIRAELFAGIFRNILPNAQVCQMTNDMWKQHRRLMGPAVTSRSLAMMTPRAVRSVKELVRLFELKRVKANGRAWAMGDDLISMTMVGLCFH